MRTYPLYVKVIPLMVMLITFSLLIYLVFFTDVGQRPVTSLPPLYWASLILFFAALVTHGYTTYDTRLFKQAPVWTFPLRLLSIAIFSLMAANTLLAAPQQGGKGLLLIAVVALWSVDALRDLYLLRTTRQS